MPPRPFPFPLNIGIDIIHVKRIRDIWLRGEGKPSHSHRFLRRFLTPGEVLEFQTRFGHVSTHRGAELDVVCRHLAGRWAAKEAAIKAVNWKRVSFHDVTIQQPHDAGVLQAVILDGGGASSPSKAPAAQDKSAPPQQSDREWDAAAQVARISISHDGDYATAVCLAAKAT